MEEQRLHRRIRVDILHGNGCLTFANEVTVLDISMGGASLQADQRLNMGVKYVLRLKGRGGPLRVKGVVIWSRLSKSIRGDKGEVVPLYTAGMKFTDLSEGVVVGLRSFIENNDVSGALAGERKTDVRFHIKAPGNTILNYPADYGVRRISVGGMLIEIDHALEIESTIPLELSLHDTKSAIFSGRIVFCRRTGRLEKKLYESGIEFVDLTSGDKKIIEAFVEYLTKLPTCI